MNVGTNSGQWAAMASEITPGSHIQSFENCPDTFGLFREFLATHESTKHYNIGTGSRDEATIFPNRPNDFHYAFQIHEDFPGRTIWRCVQI